jgi:hypothetical protein
MKFRDKRVEVGGLKAEGKKVKAKGERRKERGMSKE